MLVAIPCADGQLCMHFGHCQQFAMVEVDDENRQVKGVDFVTPPPHEPGLLPRWLAEKGASLIIAGGIGARAQSLFGGSSIEVLSGAPAMEPRALVEAYLSGSLQTGANACDH